RFFRVLDPDGRERAAFWLDPYSRPAEKRGGAWMNDCLGRSRRLAPPGQVARTPVAHLVCNQTPPVGAQPSLMTFQEVETWLHELGHGLQHMLTDVDEGLHSGIRGVEWDAVELPSQFMENWAYDPPTARGLSGHVDTGAPIPEELLAKLRAARTFLAGSDMLRQLLFGITDLCLHAGPPPADPFAVYFDVARTCTVLPPLPDDRFLCGFSHIFAGGYAAGYYGYKWAEVLSADAFDAFEEAGLDDDEAVRRLGRHFRATVLGLGGSVHPAEVFRRFRGRDPVVAALLRHAGLGS
ncbi:MAG: M3 family peptidase, partial [Myxococcales bacterium]|nr:M3 family peptidase [Myxococcales bacterium]